MAMVDSPRQNSKRRRHILEAARYCVLRQGLKATSMELIAREAAVAKGTLYAYFPDKEAVADALVEALGVELTRGVGAALAGEGDVAARVGAALTARYKRMARWAGDSPHAGDLLGKEERRAAPQLRAVEQMLGSAVADALQKAGIARPRPLAQLLIAAADGIARHATNISEIGPAIRLVTERVIGPEIG
jgi:AcrR family transcriptional regulator